MKTLTGLIRRCVPLVPVPPGLPPPWKLTALPPGPFKAVLFDLYGTLFVSAAGDTASREAALQETALNGSVCRGAVSPPDPPDGGLSARPPNPPTAAPAGTFPARTAPPELEAMTAYFKNAVIRSHAWAKAGGAAFPEVRVEEIWAGYDGPVPKGWPREKRRLALQYELAVNPVYPMPDALETITALRRRGCVLGIISNAQFFSPLLFNAFFGKTPAALGFDPRLLLWSFAEGEAKPSPRLFEKAAAGLAACGIRPGQALFVGNDMRSDVVPAAAAGFTAVLFAGDKRSLRTRGLLPEPGVPAAVIGDLRSLGGLQFAP